MCQRLVGQQNPGVAHQRPARRHKLAVPGRELGREAGKRGPTEPHPTTLLLDCLRPGRFGDTPHLEREADVGRGAPLRNERDVLEDHRHVTFCGRQPGHIESVDLDAPRFGLLQTGHHPQQAGFTAPGRAYQGEDLPACSTARST